MARNAAAGAPTDSSKMSTKTNRKESTNRGLEDKPVEKGEFELPGRTVSL